MIRRRREAEDMSADEVEQFFGSLPRVIRELRQGKRVNRFLVLFVIIAFLVVSYRTEIQQDQIRAAADTDRRTNFAQCQVANDNARALNQFVDVAMASVRANPTLNRSEKAYRLDLYESIKQKLPICEAP